MTDDDYKELMLFHIMLSDEDISDYNYAAVDNDGGLFVYGLRPCKIIRDDAPLTKIQWTPREEADGFSANSNYAVVATLPVPRDWTKTLIKL